MKGIDKLLKALEEYTFFTDRTPTYLLLTKKFERELYLDGSFPKNVDVDEQIPLQGNTYRVLTVDRLFQNGDWANDGFQFV